MFIVLCFFFFFFLIDTFLLLQGFFRNKYVAGHCSFKDLEEIVYQRCHIIKLVCTCVYIYIYVCIYEYMLKGSPFSLFCVHQT